jgi:hypothetical protein
MSEKAVPLPFLIEPNQQIDMHTGTSCDISMEVLQWE